MRYNNDFRNDYKTIQKQYSKSQAYSDSQSNFKPFLIDNAKSLAICEWCQSISILSGNG